MGRFGLAGVIGLVGGLEGIAVATQVDHDHGEVLGKFGGDAIPGAQGLGRSMHEEDSGALAADDGVDLATSADLHFFVLVTLAEQLRPGGFGGGLRVCFVDERGCSGSGPERQGGVLKKTAASGFGHAILLGSHCIATGV
ncbi:MAG: hypothetical protein WDO18_10025 [Acidobacteriota bacterium]